MLGNITRHIIKSDGGRPCGASGFKIASAIPEISRAHGIFHVLPYQLYGSRLRGPHLTVMVPCTASHENIVTNNSK
jgi:hypothetical protein